MTKSPDAFRTISEVAAWLETPAHVLRFWESRFPELSPVKRAGGRRYYRPEDMQLLGGIKHLLHTEGHTIKSVQDRIKAEGTGVVIAFSPPLGEPGAPSEIAQSGSKPSATPSDPATGNPTPEARPPESSPADAPVDSASESAEATVTPDGGEPDLPATPAASDAAAMNGRPVSPPADEIPPIGFFFDDSDDAVPAESQSGTFATLDPVPEEGPEPERETVPKTAQMQHDDPAPMPDEGAAPDLPADPSDEASLGTAPVTLAARLRALVPGSLSVDQTAQLAPLVQRLRALVPGNR